MDDLDDSNPVGDSECDETLLNTHGRGSENAPSDDEPVEQPSPLPGPSGLQPYATRLRSRQTTPALPSLLTPASPPLPPPYQTWSHQGRGQVTRRAGEESRRIEWSSEPSSVAVQPFTMDVGPTFQLSAVPTEVFLHFFIPQLIELIVQETNRYAALCLSSTAEAGKPVRDWKTNPEEIRAYLGFHILIGLNHLPDLYDYCSVDECYHYFPVSSRISRKRFLEKQQFLHFVNNATKCGFKVSVQADRVIGYIPDFDVYTGKEGAPEKYLGEKVVKKLTPYACMYVLQFHKTYLEERGVHLSPEGQSRGQHLAG